MIDLSVDGLFWEEWGVSYKKKNNAIEITETPSEGRLPKTKIAKMLLKVFDKSPRTEEEIRDVLQTSSPEKQVLSMPLIEMVTESGLLRPDLKSEEPALYKTLSANGSKKARNPPLGNCAFSPLKGMWSTDAVSPDETNIEIKIINWDLENNRESPSGTGHHLVRVFNHKSGKFESADRQKIQDLDLKDVCICYHDESLTKKRTLTTKQLDRFFPDMKS